MTTVTEWPWSTPRPTISDVHHDRTTEVRYPGGRSSRLFASSSSSRSSIRVHGVLFVEAGHTWNDSRDIQPFRLKKSAGIGVRLEVPLLGNLGLDFGYGFDRDEPGLAYALPARQHVLLGTPGACKGEPRRAARPCALAAPDSGTPGAPTADSSGVESPAPVRRVSAASSRSWPGWVGSGRRRRVRRSSRSAMSTRCACSSDYTLARDAQARFAREIETWRGESDDRRRAIETLRAELQRAVARPLRGEAAREGGAAAEVALRLRSVRAGVLGAARTCRASSTSSSPPRSSGACATWSSGWRTTMATIWCWTPPMAT